MDKSNFNFSVHPSRQRERFDALKRELREKESKSQHQRLNELRINNKWVVTLIHLDSSSAGAPYKN